MSAEEGAERGHRAGRFRRARFGQRGGSGHGLRGGVCGRCAPGRGYGAGPSRETGGRQRFAGSGFSRGARAAGLRCAPRAWPRPSLQAPRRPRAPRWRGGSRREGGPRTLREAEARPCFGVRKLKSRQTYGTPHPGGRERAEKGRSARGTSPPTPRRSPGSEIRFFTKCPCQRFSGRRGPHVCRPPRSVSSLRSAQVAGAEPLFSAAASRGGRGRGLGPWDPRVAAPGLGISGPRPPRPRALPGSGSAGLGSRALADWEARRGLAPGAKNTKKSSLQPRRNRSRTTGHSSSPRLRKNSSGLARKEGCSRRSARRRWELKLPLAAEPASREPEQLALSGQF